MKKFYYLYSKPEDKKKRITMVGYVNEQKKLLQIGISECSKKDQFNKKLGKSISEGRAKKKPIKTIDIKNKNQKEILNIMYDYLNSLLEISENNPSKTIIPGGTQEIKDDSYKVNDYSLPEQGKLTQHEQKLINKYKNKGFDFTDLVHIIKQIEKTHKKK